MCILSLCPTSYNIQVMLGLFVLLCVAPVCLSVPIAKLHITEPHKRVPGEWIVLLRHDPASSIAQTAKDITQTYGPAIHVQDTYEFGRFRALRVHTDDVTIHQLRHHRDITLIHSNTIMSASASDTCVEQNTGT